MIIGGEFARKMAKIDRFKTKVKEKSTIDTQKSRFLSQQSIISLVCSCCWKFGKSAFQVD